MKAKNKNEEWLYLFIYLLKVLYGNVFSFCLHVFNMQADQIFSLDKETMHYKVNSLNHII